MSLSLRRIICLVAMISFVGISQAEAKKAEIIRVERHLAVDEGAADDSHRLRRTRMQKFARDMRAANAQYLLFFVHWAPPSNGLRSGASLHFDYRQVEHPDVKSLAIKYPIPVDKQRRATFEIGRKAFRQGGDVTSWRVRLMQNGKLLASQTSDTWR